MRYRAQLDLTTDQTFKSSARAQFGSLPLALGPVLGPVPGPLSSWVPGSARGLWAAQALPRRVNATSRAASSLLYPRCPRSLGRFSPFAEPAPPTSVTVGCPDIASSKHNADDTLFNLLQCPREVSAAMSNRSAKNFHFIACCLRLPAFSDFSPTSLIPRTPGLRPRHLDAPPILVNESLLIARFVRLSNAFGALSLTEKYNGVVCFVGIGFFIIEYTRSLLQSTAGRPS